MRFLCSAVAAAFTLASTSSRAAELSVSQISDVKRIDEQGKLVRKFHEDLFSGRFAEALRVAEQLQVDPSNREGRAVIASMKAAALLGLKREADAREQIDEVTKLAPAVPLAAVTLFHAGLLTERYDVAADAMDTLIARFPDVAREQDQESVWALLRNEPKGEERRNEDRRISLARIGFGGNSPSADWFAVSGVGILVHRGDVSGAAELIQYIDEPQAIEDMLITRRFEPLWPRLQQHAGRHLERVRASSVASAQRAYESAPDEAEKLADLANALRHAGRLDEAIALRAKLPATPQAMSAANEQMGWAINNVALALHEAGRREEADQLFAMLNEAPMAEEFWRISMKINRLDLLVQDGRYEEALPLVEPTAKTEGSAYAEQLVRRLRYCILSALGRKEEAATRRAELLKNASEAPGPTIDGLLCAGEVNEAEGVALESLRATGARKAAVEEDLARKLQPIALTSDDAPVWHARWKELRARPAIGREFDRIGRDMPVEFIVPRAPPDSRE